MAESNKTILTLGALIIAGVALFFIGSYVGQTIKVGKSKFGTDVYTKVEVDSLFSKLKITDIPTAVATGIDQRLDKCMTWTTSSADKDTVYATKTCSESCKQNKLPETSGSANQKCLWVGLLGEEKNEFNGDTQDLRIIDKGACSTPIKAYFDGGYKQITCFCC